MMGAQKLSTDELKALAADVARLSRLLTKERGDLPAAYLKDHGLRRAYLRYFLPANIHKILTPLEELSLHPKNMLSKERLRILDIGTGPGTVLLGVMEFFARQAQKPSLEFIAADHVVENLKEAEALFQEYRNEHHINAALHTVKSSVERLEHHLEGRFDIIVLSNVLNELVARDEERIARRTGILKNILSRFLAEDGSCVIIEPALHETSREMLMVRDGLLDEGFHVYAPCLTGETCPALVNPKDWCHEDRPWDPPEIVKEIDSRIGLRKDSLKFSYLVLRRDDCSLADVYGERALRVVSEPLVSKGKIEFYICGPGGRRHVTRLDKDKTAANDPFERLRRGNVVRFDRLIDEGKRFRVGKDTLVQVKHAP